MLTAMGWVENSSQLAARDSSSPVETVLSAGIAACTWKLPLVMVPVLSMTTALMPDSASMALPPLNRMPFLDAAPMPEKKASGTLSTSAQGQEMTRKVSAVRIEAVPEAP